MEPAAAIMEVLLLFTSMIVTSSPGMFVLEGISGIIPETSGVLGLKIPIAQYYTCSDKCINDFITDNLLPICEEECAIPPLNEEDLMLLKDAEDLLRSFCLHDCLGGMIHCKYNARNCRESCGPLLVLKILPGLLMGAFVGLSIQLLFSLLPIV